MTQDSDERVVFNLIIRANTDDGVLVRAPKTIHDMGTLRILADLVAGLVPLDIVGNTVKSAGLDGLVTYGME